MTSCDGVRVSVDRRRRRRAAAIAPLCLLVAGLLAGCSTNDGVGSFIVDPGHYSVYHCDGLAARLKVLLAREQELTNLMDRASEGGGGVLIGNLTYRADYENAVGEEKVLRRTAAEKKCELPPPAARASPTPAAYTAPPPGYTAPPQAPANAPVFQSDQTIR
jgi:predicted small secreted protein